MMLVSVGQYDEQPEDKAKCQESPKHFFQCVFAGVDAGAVLLFHYNGLIELEILVKLMNSRCVSCGNIFRM